MEVDFNALDTTLNVQTWVVLLDFLGIGGAKPDKSTNTEEEKDDTEKDKGMCIKDIIFNILI